VESDLFGELPDVLLDPEMLTELWRGRVEPIVQAFQTAGLSVFIGGEKGFRAPDGFFNLPYVYQGDLTEETKAAYKAAQQHAAMMTTDLRETDLSGEDAADTVMLAFAPRGWRSPTSRWDAPRSARSSCFPIRKRAWRRASSPTPPRLPKLAMMTRTATRQAEASGRDALWTRLRRCRGPSGRRRCRRRQPCLP